MNFDKKSHSEFFGGGSGEGGLVRGGGGEGAKVNDFLTKNPNLPNEKKLFFGGGRV